MRRGHNPGEGGCPTWSACRNWHGRPVFQRTRCIPGAARPGRGGPGAGAGPGGLKQRGEVQRRAGDGGPQRGRTRRILRRKGLFPQQIEAWRENCRRAQATLAPKADRERLRSQAREIRQLAAGLRRKEKALAEAATLLVLQERVRTLWAEPEDERTISRGGNR